MSQLLIVLLLVVYPIAVIVLPISTANAFMSQRGLSVRRRVGMGLYTLLGGIAGFVVTIFLVARLRTPGHDLMDMWGMVAVLVWGLLVGVPIGTWAGAWITAWLSARYTHGG